MTTINDYLRTETNKLVTDCNIFFAFSDSQMVDGLNKLNLTIKDIYSIGAGGFIPKTKMDQYKQGLKDIDNKYNEMLKDEKTKQAYILYELHNHEAFYTGDITSTIDAISENITRDEVLKVYKNHNANKCGCNG